MRVVVNIEASTAAELAGVAQALLSISGAVEVPGPAPAPTPDTAVVGDISGGKKTRAPRTPKKGAAHAALAKSAKEMLEASEGPVAEVVLVPSLAEARAAGEAFANQRSVAEARAVMTRFGVERIADIPEERRAEFIAAVTL